MPSATNKYRPFTYFVLVTCLTMSACAKRSRVMRDIRAGHTENGIASWYGEPYHNRPTASGEVYDMHQLTAAHRRLPFGTTARIENKDNGRSVDVRINDRGPFVKGRIVDLSRAAAEQAGLLRAGTAKVRLRVTAPPPRGAFAVSAGDFASLTEAYRVRDRLRSRYPLLRVIYISNSRLYRVVCGNGTRAEAETLRGTLVRGGYPSAQVIPLPSL